MATRRQLRAAERYGLTDLVTWKKSGNASFPVTTYNGSPAETITDDFVSYVQRVYKRNGVVAACMIVRAAAFSSVRFRFAGMSNGRIGNLFGGPELDILQHPFGPTSTTGDLLTRMIQDADTGGQFYAVKRGGRLWRRRPDKVVIALSGDPTQEEFVSAEGYLYYPNGVTPGGEHYTYLPEDVCHWTPLPDPEAEYKGMSWLTPILREIRSDDAATDHKLEFFDNAATPNMVVKTPESVMTQQQFDDFLGRMNAATVGRGNRHKTLYLVPGADVTVVGRDFQQMEFNEIIGRDEDRIASAAGVPAVILGLKESLQGSSLNTGNFGQARRRFADLTMHPLYASACGALGQIVQAPQRNGPSILWYDTHGVAFFREDRKDAADIMFVKAQAIRQLTDAGYTPESSVLAVENEDPALLKHSGLYSVQLQPAGAMPAPALNGAN